MEQSDEYKPCPFTTDIVRELDGEDLSEEREDELEEHRNSTCRACHKALLSHGRNLNDEDQLKYELQILEHKGEEALIHYITTADPDFGIPIECALERVAFFKRVSSGNTSDEDKEDLKAIQGREFSEEEMRSIVDSAIGKWDGHF